MRKLRETTDLEFVAQVRGVFDGRCVSGDASSSGEGVGVARDVAL